MGLLLASRKSDLARIQAYQVGEALQKSNPNLQLKYFFRQSLGDINQNDPLWEMPEKGVFTEDFRQGLIAKKWDLVVHSWKDLPISLGGETEIIGTLPRADIRDLFLFKKANLDKVKARKKINILTSSPRRIFNLEDFFKKFFPGGLEKVEFISVRGNIQTRVEKLFQNPEVDGLIVAKAALDRLLSVDKDEFSQVRNQLKSRLEQCLWQVLPISRNPTAAAQGALAIEARKGREDIKKMVAQIHCPKTWEAVQSERKILHGYGGGCHQKIGVNQVKEKFGDVLSLQGLTDQGERLNRFEILNSPIKAFTSEESFPLDAKDARWYERVTIPYKRLPAAAHYVARANALPEGEKISEAEVLWVSGLRTWEKLAQRGLWVHGSSDSLGETNDFGINNLSDSLSWVKWTHDRGASSSRFKNIATYRLIPLESRPNLDNKKNFYWMSGTSFLQAIEDNAEVLHGAHFCGPGNTFTFICQVLEERGLKNFPNIILTHGDWLEKTIKRGN